MFQDMPLAQLSQRPIGSPSHVCKIRKIILDPFHGNEERPCRTDNIKRFISEQCGYAHLVGVGFASLVVQQTCS